MNGTRVCTSCHESKPPEGFHRRGENGLRSECKICIRERNRRWREGHREQAAALKRKWVAANPEMMAAYRRRWKEAHPDKVASYRDANPHHKWKSLFLKRCRGYGIAPVLGAPFTMTDVVDRYGESCVYCKGGEFEELDHYVPISKGGPHTLANVRPSCVSCNRSKHNVDPEEFTP